MDDSTVGKVCCSCTQAKALTEFHRFHRAPDGRQPKCRECCAEYQRRYNAVHGAKRAKARKLWGELNLERQALAKTRWQLTNPEKRAEIKARRRAREVAATVGPVDLEALWTGACGICGAFLDRQVPYPDPMSQSLDHIIPLALGGGHVQDNLQWAHLRCNVSKGARSP